MLLLLVILVLASLLFALLTYWLGQRVLSAAIGLAYLLNSWGLGCVRSPHTPQLPPLY